MKPGVYDNVMNYQLSLLRNVYDMLNPSVSYGNGIPDIPVELRSRVLLLLDEERDQMGPEMQAASIVVTLDPSLTDPDSIREMGGGSNKAMRILKIKFEAEPTTPLTERRIVKTRLALNMLPGTNLPFWDTHNSPEFTAWEEIGSLYVHKRAENQAFRGDSGRYVVQHAVSLLYSSH